MFSWRRKRSQKQMEVQKNVEAASCAQRKLLIKPAHCFWEPKDGNNEQEYEDAHAYFDFRFAVADGATESMFAREWAKMLVGAFTSLPSFSLTSSVEQWREWLEPLQREWSEMIDWDNLPWFALDKTHAGAFSTLLCLEFLEGDLPQQIPPAETSISGVKQWRAIAIGDSCLFHVRNDSVIERFPLDRAEQFGNRPLLLSSNSSNNQQVLDKIKTIDGDTQPGDLFFLATDAIAQWFLNECEAGEKPWSTLYNLKTKEDFAALVAQLRRDHGMRNDDTTLLVIRAVDDDTSPPDGV